MTQPQVMDDGVSAIGTSEFIDRRSLGEYAGSPHKPKKLEREQKPLLLSPTQCIHTALIPRFPVNDGVISCGQAAILIIVMYSSTLDDGTYRITVHPANESGSSSSIIDRTITIEDQSSISIVAQLNAAGSPGLALYNNTVLGIAVGVRHVASAPSLAVRIKATPYPTQRWPRIRNSGDGAVFVAWDSALDYRITVSLTRQGKELSKLTGKFRSNRIIWRYFYIVGSVKNGLEIVQQDIRLSNPS